MISALGFWNWTMYCPLLPITWQAWTICRMRVFSLENSDISEICSSFCSPCVGTPADLEKWFQLFLGGGKRHVLLARSQKWEHKQGSLKPFSPHAQLFSKVLNNDISTKCNYHFASRILGDKQDKAPLPSRPPLFAYLCFSLMIYHFILNYNQCKEYQAGPSLCKDKWQQEMTKKNQVRDQGATSKLSDNSF